MSLPPQLKDKIKDRFDKLISKGEELLSNPKVIQKLKSRNMLTGEVRTRPEEHVDFSGLVKWRTDCNVLLSMLFSNSQVHNETASSFNKLKTRTDNVQWGIATLKSLKENLEEGFLDDLSAQIGAEIASDYMTQAENLIGEGAGGAYNHVPAAVLSGVVLEKALRELCEKQEAAISTVKANGEHKTMNPLIDDLKKAGVYNETRAKQLRHFADIRNHAAHGRFDEFNVDDVKAMIEGVNRFLSEYLG